MTKIEKYVGAAILVLSIMGATGLVYTYNIIKEAGGLHCPELPVIKIEVVE